MAKDHAPTYIPAFSVIGVFARTNNDLEMSPAGGHIGGLWQSFMSGARDRIPSVADPDSIYSVYTAYDSDHSGLYDVILGRAVNIADEVPDGMKVIEIPAARYLVFPADNPSPQAIVAAWMRVYSYFAGETEFVRAFTADFEKYGSDGIALYIAVR